MTRICAFCEQRFTPTFPKAPATRQRFCSRDCQVRAWRDTLWLRKHPR